MLTQILLCN